MDVDSANNLGSSRSVLGELLRVSLQQLLQVQSVHRDSRSMIFFHCPKVKFDMSAMSCKSAHLPDELVSRDQCLPGGLDLSPEILGLVDKELAGLSQRTEKILLQTQLVAILEDFPAVNISLDTSCKENNCVSINGSIDSSKKKNRGRGSVTNR